jgi:predicted amidohydrolase
MAYVQQTAETIPGQSTSNIVAKAKELNLFVVFGMTEKDGADLLYNTSVLLGPDGVLGKHRKRYLADSNFGFNEHLIWRTGQVWDVVESPLGKVGLMICIELGWYPGPVLANQGADLLVTASGWPAFGGDGGGWDTYTTGNASQAKRWHVVSNQVGAAGHIYGYGHSRVVDPKGTIICDTGTGEGLVMWATDILIDARTP